MDVLSSIAYVSFQLADPGLREGGIVGGGGLKGEKLRRGTNRNGKR